LVLLAGGTNAAKADHDEKRQEGNGQKQKVSRQEQSADEDEQGGNGEKQGGNGEEREGNGDEKGGNGEKQGGNGDEEGGNGDEKGCYKYKKVVTYKTVIDFEIRSEKYVKCVTLYDECDKPYKVNKVYYRDIKVPVKKVVAVVTWVKSCEGDDDIPPVPQQ
jgi:hypothetical protein